jgi:hypothetical protein
MELGVCRNSDSSVEPVPGMPEEVIIKISNLPDLMGLRVPKAWIESMACFLLLPLPDVNFDWQGSLK